MDGILFYWLSWLVWIFILFFIPKKVSSRFEVLFHILAVLTLVEYQFSIAGFSAQLTGPYLFLTCLIYLRRQPVARVLGWMVKAAIIGLAYASFQLFSILDPIWVVVKPSYILCILLNYVILLLVNEWKQRLLILLMGMAAGDLLFSLLLYYHSLPYRSFDFIWHDTTALVLTVNMSWRLLELLIRAMILLTQSKLASWQKRENLS